MGEGEPSAGRHGASDDASIEAVEAALVELGIWSAESRVRAEASSRSRERWILQQQMEDASMTGVLVELAEKQETLTIQTSSADHVGALVAVGPDLAVIEDRRGATTLVEVPAIVSVEAPASQFAETRSPALDLTFNQALRALASDLVPVRLYLRTGTISGRLSGAGEDVVVVQREIQGAPARPRRQVTVTLAAVEACALR